MLTILTQMKMYKNKVSHKKIKEEIVLIHKELQIDRTRDHLKHLNKIVDYLNLSVN